MILCFGEISWDRLSLIDNVPNPGAQAFVKKEASLPGGCTLNTAVHLAMMGEKVVLGGNDIGNDIYGKRIKEIIENLGIIFLSKESSHKETPICDVLIDDKSKERSFILHHSGIQEFRPNMFDEIEFNKINTAFIDPYLKEASNALLELIQDKPIKIWLQDLKSDDPRVALGDIVQISLDESFWFDQTKVKYLAQEYFRGRCKTVVVTAGKHGAFLINSDGLFISEESQKVDVVDTTGCGDAFRAGAMIAWKENKGAREILKSGIERGSYQAKIFGSNPISVPSEIFLG